MRFRRRAPFDCHKSLFKAANGLYSRSDWLEKEFLAWLSMHSPRSVRKLESRLSSDSRVEKGQVLRLEILKDLLASEGNYRDVQS